MKVFAVIFLMIPLACFAGKGKRRSEPDSVRVLRDLTQIMRGWQKAPLQAGIRMVRGNSVQTADSDTSTINGEFWLSDSLSYVRMGPVEQVVTGSKAVMVNHSLRRVLVFEDAPEITQMMMLSSAGLMKDTSLARLSAKYHLEKSVYADTVSITLVSRDVVDRGKLPHLELLVKASSTSLEPYSVTSVRRLAIQIDSTRAATLEAEGRVTSRNLVLMPDGNFLLVQESSLRIDYLYIRHEIGKLPGMLVSDVVTKDAAGDYEAVGACRGYTVSKEN